MTLRYGSDGKMFFFAGPSGPMVLQGLTALCLEVGRDDLRGTFASEVILVRET